MSVVTEWQQGFVARENLGRVVGRMRIAARNAGVLWILLAAQLLEVVDLKFAYDCKFLLWFTQRKANHSVYTVVVWKFQKILFQSLLLWPPTSTYNSSLPVLFESLKWRKDSCASYIVIVFEVKLVLLSVVVCLFVRTVCRSLWLISPHSYKVESREALPIKTASLNQWRGLGY